MISLKPQQRKSTKDVWWYYENTNSIDVLVDATKPGVMRISIPKTMLKKSLARMDNVPSSEVPVAK